MILTDKQRTFLEMVEKMSLDRTCSFLSRYPNTTRLVLKNGEYTEQGKANLNKLVYHYKRWKACETT